MPLRWVRHAVVASTMDEARALAVAGAPAGTVVRADRQESGRGRLDRAWASPPGGLWMSLVLRPAAPVLRWSLLPLAAGCAVAAALRAQGRAATLRWPNDVLLAGRKVAGILVETRVPDFAVVGVGVNAAVRLADLPPALAATAATADLSPDALADSVAQGIVDRAALLDARGAEPILMEWRSMASTLGTEVDRAGVRGLAVDVDEDGALLVRQKDGTTRRLTDAP